MTEGRRIVVGVDGSDSSRAALRWAAGQGALSGAAVHAIGSWEYPAFYSWEGGPMPPDDFEKAAAKSLEDTVEAVEDERGARDSIERELRHGDAAQILIDASDGAELLVVGSRGHGSFYGAVLGSVSQRVAQHATCPVVIIRA
ncbi:MULTISPECIES: universal stress protein [Saccharopolyspora]|uniref:Universal stress protein n=1 Tax=Saccharopolyspora cebuensis TaxID=418759 RepID=A0ABV4CAC0_9PSEU